METAKPAGLFVNLKGREGKVVIWYHVSGFHDSYDVHRFSRRFGEIDVIRHLAKLLPEPFADFLENLTAVDEKQRSRNPHRTRRYFAKTPSELYPNRDCKFTEEHSEEIKGLWIANNVGAKEIVPMVKEICEACKIKFLSSADLQF